MAWLERKTAKERETGVCEIALVSPKYGDRLVELQSQSVGELTLATLENAGIPHSQAPVAHLGRVREGFLVFEIKEGARLAQISEESVQRARESDSKHDGRGGTEPVWGRTALGTSRRRGPAYAN